VSACFDFPDLSAAEVETMLRARAAPPPEPGIIPRPEYPYPLRHLLAGTVRYRCPHDCGWWHDELPDMEQPGPLVFPADPTPADITQAITTAANARHDAYRARVECVLTEHFDAAHEGRPTPNEGER